MRLTKKKTDNGKHYLSGLAEVSNSYIKGYGQIQVGHAIEKLAEYEDLEERLRTVYGECDGLLEMVVEHLEHHENVDIPEPVFKSRLLTDEEVDRWEEYKTLEEQGKLLVLAYEICVVSECTHCKHIEQRVEEVWIRPELLGRDGFYKTKESAEAALKEMSE